MLSFSSSCHHPSPLRTCDVRSDLPLSQVPLICETKPVINIQQLMNCQNKNGSYQPPPPGVKPGHIPPDVARLIQLEEGVRPPPPKGRKKPPVPPRHLKEHCAIDMNGLETNV